ncbi:MAG: RNA polymerase sigma factor [Pirellulales bacterium]|nr:RNA polymerase sigma factor [Pirellulales bacterium]
MQPTLITQLVAGDHEAFAALYDRLGEKLYATAVQLNCTHQEAEDIAHDLFVELARHRQQLSDVKYLDAYIFTMLRNAVSRLQRRKKIGLKAFLQWASDQVARNRTHDVPATLPDDNLSKALNLLPEGQRTVLILKVISGLSFKQISSVVGIKTNTAASRYRYAIQKLKGTLGPEDE